MQLDLTALEKSVHSLAQALNDYQLRADIYIRDACIQRFEYTYETTWKMLKRHLEISSANPADIDEMSFQNLIRLGCEKSLLLSDWSKWKIYRQARGTTSHAYDEIKAQEVFKQIPGFLAEAQYLLKKLQEQN